MAACSTPLLRHHSLHSQSASASATPVLVKSEKCQQCRWPLPGPTLEVLPPPLLISVLCSRIRSTVECLPSPLEFSRLQLLQQRYPAYGRICLKQQQVVLKL